MRQPAISLNFAIDIWDTAFQSLPLLVISLRPSEQRLLQTSNGLGQRVLLNLYLRASPFIAGDNVATATETVPAQTHGNAGGRRARPVSQPAA